MPKSNFESLKEQFSLKYTTIKNCLLIKTDFFPPYALLACTPNDHFTLIQIL